MIIGCVLVTDGKLKNAQIEDKMLMELIKNLKNEGKEMVHFKDSSIEVEGIYIPAKNNKATVIILSGEDDEM